MKPSNQTMIHFYQQLGKLFYIIASIDKTVSREEIQKLDQIVKKEWVPIESATNEFGDDAAYQIEIVFDWLAENEWHSSKFISDFENFSKEHQSLFTPKTNALILQTANAIAESFAGQNQLELDLIAKLESILQH